MQCRRNGGSSTTADKRTRKIRVVPWWHGDQIIALQRINDVLKGKGNSKWGFGGTAKVRPGVDNLREDSLAFFAVWAQRHLRTSACVGPLHTLPLRLVTFWRCQTFNQ